MTTYPFTTSKNPDLKGTLLLESLDAQKHYILNAVFKYDNLASQEKDRIRKLNKIQFKGNSYSEEILALITSCTEEKYAVFTKVFRGKAPVERIIGWISEITKVHPSKHMCLHLTQTRANLLPVEEAKRIRPTVPFDRKNSPICMGTQEGKQPLIYAYLMLMDLENMP